MAIELHVGDVGIPFDVILVDEDKGEAVDFSGASATILFQSPAGPLLTREGEPVVITLRVVGVPITLPGVRYYLQEGDLTVPGTWRFQVRYEDDDEVKYGPVAKFKVKINLPLEL